MWDCLIAQITPRLIPGNYYKSIVNSRKEVLTYSTAPKLIKSKEYLQSIPWIDKLVNSAVIKVSTKKENQHLKYF